MAQCSVGIRSHLANLGTIKVGVISSIACPWVLGVLTETNPTSHILLGVIIFVVMVVPAASIHLNYYLVNRNDVFSYDSIYREVTIDQKNVSFTFKLDDIKCIKRFMSPNLAANRALVSPCDEYNYSIIIFENGKEFIVTSLLLPNLNLPVDHEKLMIKKTLFRWVRGV
jgi:hypothetical protein